MCSRLSPLFEVGEFHFSAPSALTADDVMMVVTAVAAPVDEFAVGGLKSIELPVIGEKRQVTVYGGQADGFAGGTEFGVDVLRTTKVL